MYLINELIKLSKKTIDSKPLKLCVLGNCSTQFLTKAIKGFGAAKGLNIVTFEAGYDQTEEEILNPDSEMYRFGPDIIVIYLCTEKLYEDFCKCGDPGCFAENTVSKIKIYHEKITANTGAKIIQFNFAEVNDNLFGNFSAKTRTSFIYQIRKLNYLIQELMSSESGVFPYDLLSLQARFGYEKIFPSVQYHSAKLTIGLDYLPYVAKGIVDIISAMNGQIKKCIIIDLDNTIWGGNVGDRDIGELEIGSIGRGHAFSDFQRYIKQLKKRGIMLAVCSKNNEDTAKRPFEELDDMELRLSDFIIFTANWKDKAANIKNIINVLNISPDTVVFIDDNRFERNAVKNLVPDVTVPEMPEDPADYVSFIRNCNYFEVASFSDDDKNRAELYQTEFKRKESISDFSDYDSYLKSLCMYAAVEPFSELRYKRISELSQRSNQFNLRTIRYTEDDIRRIAESEDHITLCFTLNDRFGSYGMISAVIMKKISDDTVFIDTWIMSCRVLKRGVEEFVINSIVKSAKENGYCFIEAEYIPTAKNLLVKSIYTDMGFDSIAVNRFRLNIADFKPLICNITDSAAEV